VHDYSLFKNIHVEQAGRLLHMELNRPHALNAIGDGLHEELEAIFAMIATDRSVGAVLLTGAGRSFCAGADIKELEQPDLDGMSPVARVDNMVQMARRLVRNLLNVDQPIVAAVHGYAMGLGANLALFCDIVFAADDAVFADNHVNVGLVAGDGGTVIWPMLLPMSKAKYYLLTGDRIDGRDAERLGLVHKAVPAELLRQEARAIAERLANGPSLAINGTKRGMNKLIRDRVELALDTALIAEGLSFLSEDHQEASAAFVEKRDPVFRGR
jgi:enoyl-CoA hydratase